MWLEILVCILSGAGAGVGTGFLGLSAAVFITPMLVSFLHVPVYDAVGIALASDVLASAVSACTYARERNIDLRNARILLISVIVSAIGGSILAFRISSAVLGNNVLGYWSIAGSLFLGLKFIFFPSRRKENVSSSTDSRIWLQLLCGIYIGFLCGFQGTGGGLMMLFVLTTVMKFEVKKAVGTSVFIMTFTALIGAVTHFYINGMPDYTMMVLCVVSTLLFARIGSVIANKTDSKKLNLITGILLSVSGIIMLAVKIISG